MFSIIVRKRSLAVNRVWKPASIGLSACSCAARPASTTPLAPYGLPANVGDFPAFLAEKAHKSDDVLHGISVMSIHQAKNRQFDQVVLLWPPSAGGSNEQKARLLYNGVTRAVRHCNVFALFSALSRPASSSSIRCGRARWSSPPQLIRYRR